MIMTDDNDYSDSYDTSDVIKSKLMNSKSNKTTTNLCGNKKIMTEIISILVITIVIIIIIIIMTIINDSNL